MDKKILNEAQRRRVSITFALVEKELYEMEEWINTERRAGVLYKMENNISKEIRDALQEKIDQIRQIIKDITEEFSLGRETISLRQKLKGGLSLLGVDIEEIESRQAASVARPSIVPSRSGHRGDRI